MPGRAQHLDVALVVGAGVAVWHLRDLDWDAAAAQSIGCLLGGAVGGLLPDVLEPAVSSWHRKSFHSAAALSSAASLPQWAREPLAQVRAEAGRCKQMRATHVPGCPEHNRLWSRELLCWLLLGCVMGAAFGYVSHLVLDSRTPRGIRLF